MALYGRNGESPLPVLAAKTPGDCFYAAIEAVRIALAYLTPVILLSDGYIANGAEPWLHPEPRRAARARRQFAPHRSRRALLPYVRDPRRSRGRGRIPGTPGLEHRIGGLEKEDVTGNISYDPDNHDAMTRCAREKVARIAAGIPELEVGDPDGARRCSCSAGAARTASIAAAARQLRRDGGKVAHAHLRYLNPLPAQHSARCSGATTTSSSPRSTSASC